MEPGSPSTTPDLDELLPLVAAGDPEAFGRWIAGAEHRLRASLQHFARSVDVESVLQECLLRVWQVAPRVETDGRGDSLLRLAIRIARNLAISELRKNRLEPTAPEDLERLADDSQDTANGPALPDPLLRRIIAGCRAALPKKQARALEARLRARGNDADETLAQRLGMRTNTFLQNFGRARRSLRECLKRHGVDLAEVLRG